MTENFEAIDVNSYWFVGAAYDGVDQTSRFVETGIWEINPEANQIDSVKFIEAGDRIAIKSTYTRKNELPFDNRGHTVSVMLIKAIGTVIENVGGGNSLKVDWDNSFTPKEWYFFTSRNTVWRVIPETELRVNLIDFAFDGKAQDIDMFRNNPYWLERFGDSPSEHSAFEWTTFYEEMASKLLAFRYRRDELVTGIHKISETSDVMSILNDQYEEGVEGGLLKDICPFTVMAIFNRGITDDNRKIIAKALAELLDITEPVPESFDGIPIVNNQRTWFFGYHHKRQADDIDIIWEVFARAIAFADLEDEGESEEAKSRFVAAYDSATNCYGIGWNLTMGLYWIRPWSFLTLDGQSQEYINKKLNIEINKNGPKARCDANDYLELLESLETRFLEETYPVHSFPELSLAAYQYKPSDLKDLSNRTWKEIVFSQLQQLCHDKDSFEFTDNEFLERFTSALAERFPKRSDVKGTVKFLLRELASDGKLELISKGRYRWLNEDMVSSFDTQLPFKTDAQAMLETYSIDDITSDGCFLPKAKIEMILKRFRAKKNLILQGPPGTGKTWLAKRLAFALMGQRDDSKIRAVQFHPNLSYEDFIRGWRPSGEGKLTLVDGPFMEMIKAAIDDPESKYVIVIEEINRGNPAQVFGEMLTLLETDKRTPDEALELSYRKFDGERVYIPSNLYVIGTMNIADRSLALVDLALRRRFAFIDLEPTLGKPWHDWVQSKNGIDSNILNGIDSRIRALNEEISTDTSLGAQFQIGHSYVTPAVGMTITNAKEWFSEVVQTEIGPLLDEYWFDDLEKSQKAQKRLMKVCKSMSTEVDHLSEPYDYDEIKSIGEIPVRNLWLLMLYASDMYREFKAAKISVENNPDDIPDLIAEMLCRRVEHRIQRNLSYSYQSRDAVLNRVRGRIDLLSTERNRLLDRGKVACHFDELTLDTARNRYVRAALESISKIVKNKDLAHRCRSLDVRLRRMGVSQRRPSRSEVSVDRFGRHDAEDQPMITAAHLAFNLALPTEFEGMKQLNSPERNNLPWLRKLFEKGVAGFYDTVLSKQSYRISAGKTLRWQIEDKSLGIDKILPNMKTDILIDDMELGHRLVIDTKFNAVVINGWFRDETLRSGYLYQMYAYLRSQEGSGDPLNENASGLLLHPSVGKNIDEYIVMQNHKIQFATVDLAATAIEIREQLLQVIDI